MSLQKEIDEMAKVIRADKYPMSIGEMVSIYKEGDIDVHPEFQRIFRWDIAQKSNLIESILLGIPIPEIFVSQNELGVWDVIDGQQRLSTIFEFIGILKNESKEVMPVSKLTKTKFLPSLEGKLWEGENDGDSLTEAQRRFIKRAKLDITIIDKSSDQDVKYELFQRLNTGGSRLSPQEVRNCLLVMINEKLYATFRDLKDNENFSNCIPLGDNSIDQQSDMELIVRYFIARNSDIKAIKSEGNIHEYLTDQIVKIAKDVDCDLEEDKNDFIRTFIYLNSLLGEDSFKRYNESKKKFEGPVLVSAFEVIVLGLSRNLDKWTSKRKEQVIELIKSIYTHSVYVDNIKRGVRPTSRFRNLLLLSLELFADENKIT